MAGITANSSSKTMTSGDTAADKLATGYVRNERVTLGVVPAASESSVWSLSVPTGSNVVRSALSSDTSPTPSFVPDIGGTYSLTCQVDGVTTYVMRLTALDTAASEPVEAVRFPPREDAQVAAPTAGVAVFYSGTQTGLAQKDSSGTTRKLATEAYVDAAVGGSQAEYGELYWSTPAATALAMDTWTKAAGTTTLWLANDFTMPANNRLRHDDADTEIYHVTSDFTITAGGNNQTVWLGISKNGAEPALDSQRYRRIGTGADAGMGAVSGLFSLASGDYVELWVKNETSTATVTIERAVLTAVKVV